ncbi:MAG: shikimate kinase [Treponema sp.]|jgi:shikimate kinase|nr:shikimate kinase [Treponema sp.]
MGPKHAGKTSAGLALAALLAGEFVDLDALIETRTGKSPRLLYTEGPELFKEAEARALESLIPPGEKGSPEPEQRPLGEKEGPVRIIAAGGGIIDNPKALALLKRPGGPLLVYLEVSAETAWERISLAAQAGKGLPPFLNTGTPQATHRQLHDRRAAAYKGCAHLTIAAGEKTPQAIGREIVSLLGLRGE